MNSFEPIANKETKERLKNLSKSDMASRRLRITIPPLPSNTHTHTHTHTLIPHT